MSPDVPPSTSIHMKGFFPGLPCYNIASDRTALCGSEVASSF